MIVASATPVLADGGYAENHVWAFKIGGKYYGLVERSPVWDANQSVSSLCLAGRELRFKCEIEYLLAGTVGATLGLGLVGYLIVLLIQSVRGSKSRLRTAIATFAAMGVIALIAIYFASGGALPNPPNHMLDYVDLAEHMNKSGVEVEARFPREVAAGQVGAVSSEIFRVGGELFEVFKFDTKKLSQRELVARYKKEGIDTEILTSGVVHGCDDQQAVGPKRLARKILDEVGGTLVATAIAFHREKVEVIEILAGLADDLDVFAVCVAPVGVDHDLVDELRRAGRYDRG